MRRPTDPAWRRGATRLLTENPRDSKMAGKPRRKWSRQTPGVAGPLRAERQRFWTAYIQLMAPVMGPSSRTPAAQDAWAGRRAAQPDAHARPRRRTSTGSQICYRAAPQPDGGCATARALRRRRLDYAARASLATL